MREKMHVTLIEKDSAMKGILLWFIGIPLPIIILLYLFVF